MSAARAYRLDQTQEITVGAHFARWEPPDVMFIAYNGDLDADMVQRISDFSRVFTVPQRYVFVLIDMSRLGSVSAGARRLSARDSRGVTFRGIAMYGTSPLMRSVASLVARASDLFTGNTDNPTRFFSDEAEARAFLEDRRKVLRAQGVFPNM